MRWPGRQRQASEATDVGERWQAPRSGVEGVRLGGLSTAGFPTATPRRRGTGVAPNTTLSAR